MTDQSGRRVAFQGELGAYSELATYAFFGEDVGVVPCPVFADIFTTVDAGDADNGVIPIENSLAGSIHENYDLLLEHDLVITGEIKLRIVHCLIGRPGTRLEDIRRIYSHPQALSQCKDFLTTLSEAEQVSVSDTAGAVRLISERGVPGEVAIAGEQAARDYALEILRTGIESNHKNYTRFLVLSKKLGPVLETAKTSIVFALKNIPGALFKSLSVFALRDIDLYKIESRPIPGSPWEYLFYLDFGGDIRTETTKRAIAHLEEVASLVKVLGSYPPGMEITSTFQARDE